ncbi:MAG: hypothetical protein ACJ74Y_04825 [Bryobacteraceae bacterium]
MDQIAIDSPIEEQSGFEWTGIYRLRCYLVALAALLAVGLIAYSVTVAFVWDEGFHLLAAQLIQQGKTPYIDFCFPQPPLNAYFNAALFGIFGTSWRVTHVFASLFLAGSAYLVGEFLLLRLPFSMNLWRWPCMLLAALFTALNEVVIQFGPIAQAYASSTFFSVLAFRLGSVSIRKRGLLLVFGAGIAAGTAAGCTLLTAPILPVLLAWILYYEQAGIRLKKAAAFVAGSALPFLPIFVLFLKGPRQTFFNVVQYQALFRGVNWGDTNGHDFDVFTAWVDSAPSFLLAFFALFGIAFVRRQTSWERARRAEYYLCAWLAAALTAYISTAHPTFQRYFIEVVPFFSILAAVGFFSVTSHLADASRPRWPVTLMAGLLVLSVAKELFDNRESTTWDTYSQISAKIAKVTPPDAQFYADEQVYFLLGKTPPPGMEFSYSHKLQLSPADEKLYHIVSDKELNAQVKAGKFATVESCKDDRIEDMGLEKLFPQQVDIGDCTIFWGPMKVGK